MAGCSHRRRPLGATALMYDEPHSCSSPIKWNEIVMYTL